jgi:hypothetical protein
VRNATGTFEFVGRGICVLSACAGIIMSMHLIPWLEQHHARLLTSYENGSVKMWMYDSNLNEGRATSIEGVGWSCVWDAKLHVETGTYLPPFS